MLLALTLLSCARDAPESPLLDFEEPPSNVLMISIDTLRRDQLGRYGGEERPFLDGFLADAVVLDDHRSCSSWTYHSAICAMTGSDQRSIGFLPQRREDSSIPNLPADVDTLAQSLARGRSTALVSGNTFIGLGTGLERGYDRVVVEAMLDGSDVVDSGLTFLDQEARGDWFLHLHFMDPHMPYDPPEEYLSAVPESEFKLVRQSDFEALHAEWDTLTPDAHERARTDALARYSANIDYLDDQLARLFVELESRGALDDTLVVLWSDHGEQFWERGRFAHGNGVNYEENAAIAAFWARGLSPLVWGGVTSHEDLLPTVLGAMELSAPEGVEGRSAGTGRTCRFAGSFDQVQDRNQQSVEDGGWRLVYTWTGGLELYDLAADPLEVSDLYAPGHPEVARLWGLLEPRVRRAEGLVPDPEAVEPSL